MPTLVGRGFEFDTRSTEFEDTEGGGKIFQTAKRGRKLGKDQIKVLKIIGHYISSHGVV